MNSQDPRINPNTAPILTSSELRQPYARRAISFFFWGGVIVIGVAFFSGWFFSDDVAESDRELSPSQTTESTMVAPQIPGNPYKETSTRSGVYNFFYAMFSGIEDGLDDNPHNLDNVDHLDDMNLDGGSPEPFFMPDLEPAAGRTAQYETSFDGKILDYQGQVAGDISAIKYDDGEIKSFNFILKQALTPADETRRYTVPEDEVKVIQNGDVFFIQLDKEQTAALAAELYDGEEN